MEAKESLPTTYTNLDRFLINELTKTIPKSMNKANRKTFQCNIDISKDCPFTILSKGVLEFQRLFKHFQKSHNSILVNSLIKFLIDKQINQKPMSSILFINEYIDQNILPKYESEKKRIDSSNLNITIKNSELCLDIENIDLSKLNQTVLEHGIFEHLPLHTIYSKTHYLFIIGFLKLGFELGRNTDMSVDTFLDICNGVKVSKSLLGKVGDDYFSNNISVFRGSKASFQIDASKINDKEILVFILTSKKISNEPFLFDLDQNFNGDLNSYCNIVREKILKARSYQINIVGLTTDNYPTQIQALNQDFEDSIQNKYSDMKNIIHFRCTLHLLNLAYKDWLGIKGKLTKYENKVKNIMKVLNKKIFTKKLNRKIPTICITRWNSAFKALESIFYLRKEILKLIQNANSDEKKLLLKIKNDIKYIFSIGFLKVYPLLFHFASLMDYLQTQNISCVESIVVVEYFLKKIKNNIFKYKILDEGKKLYTFIKRRLILNKNVQLFQLASLMHPDGIVRYRQIMGKINSDCDITEDCNDYFHCINDKLLIEIYEKNRMISIDDYKNNEYEGFINALSRAFAINGPKSKAKNNDTNKIQLDIHHFFSVKLHSSDDLIDEDNDELPSTINLNGQVESENEIEGGNIEDETINYCGIIYDLNVKCRTACIVDNDNASGDIFIPKFILHKNINFVVVCIKNRSFEDATIKSVDFANDSEVSMIEKDSFINSTIEKIVIPTSISDLEDGWCRGTSKLINIFIRPDNLKFSYFNDSMIIGKSNLIVGEYDTIHFVRRDIDDVIIPSFIKRIAAYSFSECLIKNISIPKQVITISEGAFYNCCFLQNVEIPKKTKLKTIEEFSFINTAIDEISIPSTILHLSDFWCDDTTKVTFIKVEIQNETNLNENEQIEYKDDDDLSEFDYSEEHQDENNENECSHGESSDKEILDEDENDSVDKDENDENEYSSCVSSDDEILDEDENATDSSNIKKISLNKIVIKYSNEDEEKFNFDQSGKIENGENNDDKEKYQKHKDGNNFSTKKDDFYENRKSALDWMNIGNLIINNRIYLSLTEDEANQAINELYALILLPFSFLKSKCAFAINKNTQFPNYWSCLRSFKYDGKNTFANISKIASRLYVISASEVDAERAFSKLKWRFDNRRNSIKQKTMVQELHIEYQQQKKVQSNCDFPKLMWEHPEHND